MGGVFDVFSEDFQTVDLRSQSRRNCRHGWIAEFGHFACRACRVRRCDRINAVRTQEIAALSEAHDMRARFFYICQARARQRHQLEPNRQIILSNDLKLGVRQQIVNVPHPAGDRVFHGNHGQIGISPLHSRETVLKRAARHRLKGRIRFVAGDMRVCARFTLIRDFAGHGFDVPFFVESCASDRRDERGKPYNAQPLYCLHSVSVPKGARQDV